MLVRFYLNDEVADEVNDDLLLEIRGYRGYLKNLQMYVGFWSKSRVKSASKELERIECIRTDIQANVEAYHKYREAEKEQTDDFDEDRRLKREIAYRKTRATIGKLLEQLSTQLRNLARNT